MEEGAPVIGCPLFLWKKEDVELECTCCGSWWETPARLIDHMEHMIVMRLTEENDDREDG